MSVQQTLRALNQYLKEKNLTGCISYRGETAHLMRAANSQISLNATERGSKFFIELQDDKRFSRAGVSAGPDSTQSVKEAVDLCAQNLPSMPEVPFATPMKPISQLDENVSETDPAFASIDSKTMESLFSEAKKRFAHRQTEVTGAFSLGQYEFGSINTLVTDPLYHKGSDYNIEIVLQMRRGKKEVRASDVGARSDALKFDKILDELDTYLSVKENTPLQDLPKGKYRVVFGRDAIAEMVMFLGWLAISGETFEYENGMLRKNEHSFGDKILGDNFTLVDDPAQPGMLFPRTFGLNGVARKRFPLFTNGVWENLIYSRKLDCDRFGKAVNNDLGVPNFVMSCGDGPETFAEVVASCREKTVFIPYLHYMNSPDSSKGEITASSRFGTFLIDEGKVQSHLYSLRLNETLFNIFRQISWLSRASRHSNISDTYGLRMAEAIQLPAYMCVDGVNITGSSNV